MKHVALVCWALAMALGLALIAHTHVDADLSAFLPANPDPAQRVLIEQLRSGTAARTLMAGIDGSDATRRADASRALAQALRASGAFEQVQNGEQGDWQSAAALLVAHRYQLSAAVTPEHFSTAGLRDAIADTLSLLGTPADTIVRPLIERDPTGETQRIAEALTPASTPRLDHGVWVARDAPRALLLLTTRAAGADLDAQSAAIDRVRREFAARAAPGLQLTLTGAPLFAVESRTRIERQAAWLGGLGLAAVGALLLAAFASPRTLVIALLPVASGVVAGVALTRLVFGSVHGLTLAFGSTLIGEAVDYAIYFLIQANEAGWQHWRQRNWPVVRLGLLTSVCGFAVLAMSGFPGLAQLGVFSMAGLAAAALSTRFVLPVLAPHGAPGRGLRRRLGVLAGRLLRALPRTRAPLALLGVASLAFVAWQGPTLWHGDLGSLSPVPRDAQARDATLRDQIGAADAGMLVVAGGADREAALRHAEAAATALDRLVEAGALAGYDTPTRLLPSEATQRARLAALPDASTLQARLDDATRDGPLRARRLGAFVQEVQSARAAAPLAAADLRGTALQSVLDALLFERVNEVGKVGTAGTTGGTAGGTAGTAAMTGWTALLPLQPGPAPIDAARVRAALARSSAGTEIQLVDIGQSLNDLYAHYLRDALKQSLAGIAAVVAVIAWHLRSARRVARVVGPLALAVVLTMGGLAACGVTLGILHLVGLLLVVAVGSNYGLFFDHLRLAAEPDADTLASLLLANLTAVIAFGLIALSDIPALSAIGRVVAPGALLALVCGAAFSGAWRGPGPRRGH